MAHDLPTRRKIFDLEGEAQRNPDGRSRQDELAACLPGEAVELRLVPQTGAAGDAVLVSSARGEAIGELTAQYAALVAPLLRAGRPHRAKLHCLRGGVAGYPRYGARISIAWDNAAEHPHIPLDAEQLRFRRRRALDATSWRRRAAASLRRIADRAAAAIEA